MYLLGYIPADNRLYLGDKELNVISFSLLLSVLEYQTAVMRKDFETADKASFLSWYDSIFVTPGFYWRRFFFCWKFFSLSILVIKLIT